MSYDYGGPEFHEIIKHEQPGTGFWPILPINYNLASDVCGENYNLDLHELNPLMSAYCLSTGS